MSEQRKQLKQMRRVVVKIGSALLADHEVGLAADKIADYGAQIAALKNRGLELVLVSSGAVAAGCQRLGWSARPAAVHELQAAAAVGQMGLAQAYESALSAHGGRGHQPGRQGARHERSPNHPAARGRVR